ncbi:unnamed protein product, partial [Ectocarpus fasciculatus]
QHPSTVTCTSSSIETHLFAMRSCALLLLDLIAWWTMLSVRHVAAGNSSDENRTSPTPTTNSARPSLNSLGTTSGMSPRTPLGALNINTTTPDTVRQRKCRFVKALKDDVDSSSRRHAAQFGLPFEEVQKDAYKGIMSHKVCQQVVDDKCKETASEHNTAI